MHVIPITLCPGPNGFDQDSYLAPADETFTIEITNLAPNRPGLPMSATLLISSSSDPAVTPVPGQPGMWVGIMSKALLVAPTVPAGSTRSVTASGLRVGEYVLQFKESWGLHSSATLLIHP